MVEATLNGSVELFIIKSRTNTPGAFLNFTPFPAWLDITSRKTQLNQ